MLIIVDINMNITLHRMLIIVDINMNITLHRMLIIVDINMNITLHRLTLAGVLSRHGLLPKYNLDILMNDKVFGAFS